jgi:flagellar motor switch protein FliN
MVNQATALLIETGKTLDVASWRGSATVGPAYDLAIAAKEAREAEEQKQLDLRIELGRTQLDAGDVQTLRKGSVVVLDEAIGETVAVLADSKQIGRGEVVVVDGKIGVRIVEMTDGC